MTKSVSKITGISEFIHAGHFVCPLETILLYITEFTKGQQTTSLSQLFDEKQHETT